VSVHSSHYRSVGLILGPVLFLTVFFFPPFESFSVSAGSLLKEGDLAGDIEKLVFSMKTVFALLLFMITWWLTEAVPLPVTALLPAVVLPWFHLVGLQEGKLTGLTFKSVLANYANPVIYLFLGGFLIAAAMQKWKLDRRITYWFLSRGRMASDSHRVLLGVMVLSAFMSLWISNTATAAMLLPIGLGIVSQTGAKPGETRFGTAMMLGIAWAASIGGVGTIIGTPPNGIALGILDSTFAENEGYERITFVDWMKFGIPYVVILIPIAWQVLLRLFPPEERVLAGGPQQLLSKREELGRMSMGEKYTVAVFLLAVVLWVTNPFWGMLLPSSLADRVSWVDEFMIGLFAGVILFVIPVNKPTGEFVLKWEDTKTVDWGTLLLFGGGIALSDAMFRTGLASWLATSVIGMLGAPSILPLIAIVVLFVGLLSEVASNTAVTTMMVPIMISLGVGTGIDPVTLAISTALGSSLGFMLPVATPPNALVYATGYVKLSDMVRAGCILDIIGWMVTVGVLWFFGAVVFGVLTL